MKPAGAKWIAATLLLGALSQGARAETRVPVLDRHLERPATMAQQKNQVSFVERGIIWPAGTNAIAFDYFVDSEPGHDFLRVYIGNMNNPIWSLSGLNRGGRQRLTVPGSGGPLKVRFAYAKDASGDQGMDTAWVDNVAFYASGGHGLMEMHRFDQRELAVPAGWAGGGFGGGWPVSQPGSWRSASRPVGQQGLDGSASFMERTFTWSPIPCIPPNCPPWRGALAFDYFVDSEKDGDFLNVYVWPAANPMPAAPTWSISGRNKAGHAVLPVTAGAKKILFEYRKNAAASEGLDVARVDRIVIRNGWGNSVEVHDFTGRNLEVTPIRVGNGPVEWGSGGAAGGWRVVRATPNTTYVPKQQIGQALRPTWSTFSEPVLDGTIRSADLKNPTLFSVVDYGNPAYRPVRIALVESEGSGTLFLLVRLQGLSSALGSESGKVTIFLDANRTATLQGLGCPANRAWPANEDRRISFAYDIAAGASMATLSAAALTLGNCSGGFVPAGSNTWPWEAKVAEPSDDAGFLHLETKITLPAAVVSEGRLGLGFLHTSSQPTGSRVRFPFTDDGIGPVAGDVGSWETISLVYEEGVPYLSENPFPGCCYPEPSRPSVKVW